MGSTPSLPSDIEQIMNSPCPFWRDKRVQDTHLLVLIPSQIGGKALTLDYLGELIQHPQGGGQETKYSNYNSYAREAVGNQSPSVSYWVLITRDILPDSRNKNYMEQCKLVETYTTRTELGYELPGVLEVSVAILLHHVRSGERLYSDNPRTFTCCRDKTSNGYPLLVGGVSSEGLRVLHGSHVRNNFNGVAALRKI